jgi:hypothetical protein
MTSVAIAPSTEICRISCPKGCAPDALTLFFLIYVIMHNNIMKERILFITIANEPQHEGKMACNIT